MSHLGTVIHDQMRAANRAGKIGFRFSPIFTSDTPESEIAKCFGEHNAPGRGAILLRDESGAFEGLFVRCQCDTCLVHQLNFVLLTGVDLIAQGVGSRSVVHHGTNKGTASAPLEQSAHSEREESDRRQKTRRAEFSKLVKMCEQQQALMMAGKDPFSPEEDPPAAADAED
jgi:hypothetical protein